MWMLRPRGFLLQRLCRVANYVCLCITADYYHFEVQSMKYRDYWNDVFRNVLPAFMAQNCEHVKFI